MSKIKKLCVGVLLSVLLLTALVACGDPPVTTPEMTSQDGTTTPPVQTTPPETTPAPQVTTPQSTATTTEPEDPLKDTLATKHTLRFNEEGNFKILVLSDIHGQSTKLNSETKKNIELLVEREKPDLVIFDGDNTWGIKNEKVLKSCLAEMVGYIEEHKIPWAHTYGNHDAEGSNLAKDKQQAVYESFAYCVSKAGEAGLTGLGNYMLPIYTAEGDKVAFAVWVLDSGSDLTAAEKKELFGVTTTFPSHPGSNYDYIRPNQIGWYTKTSKLLEEKYGGKVPGLMAFHIALQESHTAWENRKNLLYTGDKREEICCSAMNSGLFSALLERGDVKAVVNGHDHINDFMVEYCGIKLCQAGTPTNEAIYHDDAILGGRVFILNEKNPAKIETYMSYVHEQVTPPDPSKTENIKPGTKYDFEGDEPEFIVSGYNNENTDNIKVGEIKVKVTENVGFAGSKGLAITRAKWNSSTASNNAEFKWDLPQCGKLGENRYIRVWMDLSTNGVDFRKACWGLVVDYANTSAHRTDDYDEKSPFYFMAEGSNEWVTYSHGGDGCFGAGDGQSVKGFKGWFAFPVEYMQAGSKKLDANSIVTGFYFYFSLASEEMAGKEVYIDEVTLVKDYTVFD